MITLLTDYGHDGPYVGVCHGVIRKIVSDATIIDVSHTVEPYNVEQAALVLADAVPYLPPGVHVAVVDPGVGTARRPIALECADGRRYVGPDNGILLLAATRSGIGEAVVLDAPQRARGVTTFDGRDVFAPAAAEIANGAALAQLGESVDPQTLERLELPEPESVDGGVRVRVAAVDRFGTLQLACTGEQLDARVAAPRVLVAGAAGEVSAARVRTFAEVARGELLLYTDSFARPALAVREGSAAELLRVGAGDTVIVRVA